MTVFVVVDGNNLEHDLYNLKAGTHVSSETDQLLFFALKKWAIQQRQPIIVELCLDPRKKRISGDKNVEVFIADHGTEADDIIRQRVRFHVYKHNYCVVITSDEHIRDDILEYGVTSLTVNDFVVLKNRTSPIFAALPGDISAGIFLDPFQEEDQEEEMLKQKTPKENGKNERYPKFNTKDEHDQALSRTLSLLGSAAKGRVESGSDRDHVPGLVAKPTEEEKTLIHLTIQAWPVEKGARFLRESFCQEHFSALKSVIEESQDASPEYLTSLASILIDTCGTESDFIRRGGSLMDRIRLALLQRENMCLTLLELVKLTGDNRSRIKRKLKENDGIWLEFNKV